MRKLDNVKEREPKFGDALRREFFQNLRGLPETRVLRQFSRIGQVVYISAVEIDPDWVGTRRQLVFHGLRPWSRVRIIGWQKDVGNFCTLCELLERAPGADFSMSSRPQRGRPQPAWTCVLEGVPVTSPSCLRAW